jgi:hypothetical protein
MVGALVTSSRTLISQMRHTSHEIHNLPGTNLTQTDTHPTTWITAKSTDKIT